MTIHKIEFGALGRETNFDFQYIPALDLVTEPGKAEEARGARGGGLERRNLKALLTAAALIPLAAWLALRLATAVWLGSLAQHFATETPVLVS